MNIRCCLSLALLTCMLAPWTGAAAAKEESPARKTKPESGDPLTGLRQGVPADAVKKILGEPVEIRPMEAPNGKAEVWVFVKELSRRVDQVQSSTPDVVVRITELDGKVTQQITPGQTTVHDMHYVTEAVSEVLMFNDHYVVHKVARRERKL